MLRWPPGWEKDGGRVALTEKILLTLLGTVSKPAMPLCLRPKPRQQPVLRRGQRGYFDLTSSPNLDDFQFWETKVKPFRMIQYFIRTS